MTTQAQTLAWLDQYQAHMTETIRRVGWMIEYVGGDACDRPDCDGCDRDGPPFAYTVGLFGLGHRPAEHSVPVLQLSYDDIAGRFPWEDGYAAPSMQPRPGTFHA